MRRPIVALALLLLVVVLPAPAYAASAPDRGTAWDPTARSEPLYGTRSPDEDPETQRHYVEGHDGVALYVETWLPEEKDGNAPPKRIPTVLVMTPYVMQGVEEYSDLIDYMTARGYAVAQHHVRGTGESGGCLEQTSKNQIDDGARVVEYLGRDAPWSNGKVGMYGISYDAETQISTAGFGDPKKLQYLKAIIPAASVGSQYDWNYMDGVPWTGQPLIGNTFYLAGVSLFPGMVPAPQHYPEKMECQDEVMLNSLNLSGDYTEYWKEREYRPGAPKIDAATLYVHGLRDFNVQPVTLAGFFDRLAPNTPHKGLFGVWNHAFPHRHTRVEPEWARADWFDMVTAWFDRYLKGLDTGVEEWPDVQVQASDGQWWTTDEFPTTGGPVGQLALGPDRKLGVERPKGSSTYTEQLQVWPPLPGEEVVFETRKLEAALHLTGQPILDLWLTTSEPDGHVAAKVEVIGPDGELLRHEGSSEEAVATYGVRSLQHLEPLERGWFEQEQGKPAPTDNPLRVFVRLLPTDLVVPAGGSLRVTISGSVSYSKGESLPSGSASQITILHDCKHPSALRFLMPDADTELINVRETDEANVKALRSREATAGRRDGDGLARAAVCGEAPERIGLLTRAYQ